MQLFIALGLLVTLSGAYLMHQFWSRTLTAETPEEDLVQERARPLKAA